MTTSTFDPLTRLAFSLHENKGVYALLLGSGISRGAGIPTGWEITLDLVRRVAAMDGVTDERDWEAWYIDKYGEAPDYSKLVETLAATASERRAILHGYIEPTDDDREQGLKLPTAAHMAIAQMVRSGHLKVIVTTNFDRLLENALREVGIEPTIIYSPDMLKGAEPITHSNCYVVKLHGDYKDARILNTDTELSSYDDSYDTLLDRILDEFGLIIVGWSGEWDAALRAAILRAPNRRYPTYWAARGALGQAASELATARDAQVVSISSADELFAQLGQYVQALNQSRKLNPINVELLIKIAKSYVGRPESRVDLADLVDSQLERLLEEISDEALNPNGKWSPQELIRRVNTYEDLSHPLCRIFGSLGRFGDGSEASMVHSAIRSIASRKTSIMEGLSYWIKLSEYPAILLYMSYGIALVEAQRFKELRSLFEMRLDTRDEKRAQAIDVLHLRCWEGARDELWKHFPELQNRHTPFSDHMFEVLSFYSKDIVGVGPDFQIAYEKFETLGALAYFDRTEFDTSATPFDFDIDAGGTSSVPMPMGRAGWRRDAYERIFAELEEPHTQAKLFEADFAQGRADVIVMFKNNFLRLARRMMF